jgi:hypothetical protein
MLTNAPQKNALPQRGQRVATSVHRSPNVDFFSVMLDFAKLSADGRVERDPPDSSVFHRAYLRQERCTIPAY